jgi:hypothetical protein
MSGDDNSACRPEFVDLQHALVTALTASGALGKLRAQLRLASLAVLRDEAGALNTVVPNRLQMQLLSAEQRLGLLVVDEFLASLGLPLARGMLAEEASLEAIRASKPTGMERLSVQGEAVPTLLALLRGADRQPADPDRPADGTIKIAARGDSTSPTFDRHDAVTNNNYTSQSSTSVSTVTSTTSVHRTVVEVKSITSTSVIEGAGSSSGVTKAGGSASQPQSSQRRASSQPAEVDYEPSVDYSDRSMASSLDITEFDHMEIVKQAAPSASTSDDDF